MMLHLEGGHKTYRHGTHRELAPEVTFGRLADGLRSAGVTRVTDITGLDRLGVPVAVAIRPNAATLACSAGKGLTRHAALTSAAMEALELHAAETASPNYCNYSWVEIGREIAVLPLDQLPLAPLARLQPDRHLDWIIGSDLLQGHDIAVPFPSVYMGLLKTVTHAGLFIRDSNGLTSGNSLVEAVVAGLCEVIERDAISRGHAYRTRRRVTIHGSGIPDCCRDVFDRFEDCGLETIVDFLASPTGVPVFAVHLYDTREPEIGGYVGYGAHLDSSVALSRAATEAAQARAVVIAGCRDDYSRARYQLDRGLARWHKRPISSRLREWQFEDTSASSEYLVEDANELLRRLRDAGAQSAVIVPLRTGVDYSVAKVIVPGLRGYPWHIAGASSDQPAA